MDSVWWFFFSLRCSITVFPRIEQHVIRFREDPKVCSRIKVTMECGEWLREDKML